MIVNVEDFVVVVVDHAISQRIRPTEVKYWGGQGVIFIVANNEGAQLSYIHLLSEEHKFL